MKKLEEYCLQKAIGKGSYGEVYLTTKIGTKLLFATKRISKNLLKDEKNKKYISNEINILSKISHPNIMKYCELKKTKENIYIISEFCNGGSLSTCFEFYFKYESKPFSEEVVQYLAKQLCSAIQYLHNNRILHRDIKLDNILLNFDNDKDRDELNLLKSQIKLIDFGFARYLLKEEMAESILGSPLFMDPNIFKKMNRIENNSPFSYDEKADIWSLGTVFFKLLVADYPFEADTYEQLYDKLNKGVYTIKINDSLQLSKQAISFINSMLQYNPAARLDINDLINHDFLTQPVSSFTRLNLIKARKFFHNNGDEIMMNINQMNSIWSIFENAEEEINEIEQKSLYQSAHKAVVEKQTLINGKAVDIIDTVLNDFKHILLPILNNNNDQKQNKPEKSDKNVLDNIQNNNSNYDISLKDKEMLNDAFLIMNKGSYEIEPMFIPVIPDHEDDDIVDINV